MENQGVDLSFLVYLLFIGAFGLLVWMWFKKSEP